jgi:transcriptional regulator with XRE-family HTH domain
MYPLMPPREPKQIDLIYGHMQIRGASMSDLANSLKQGFKDRDYRHGYADEFLNSSIATQVKVLREQHGWSQKELAKLAQMRQPRISVLENVNYSSWSINILRKLAEAFDLTLCVSFESFGKRLADIERFSREALERFSFEDDPVFAEAEAEAVEVEVKVTAATKALPDAQERESLEVRKPLLRVIPSLSAGTSQGKGKPQGEDVVPQQRGIIGIGEHPPWEMPKRATA